MTKKTKKELKEQSKNGDDWDEVNTNDWIDSFVDQDSFDALNKEVSDNKQELIALRENNTGNSTRTVVKTNDETVLPILVSDDGNTFTIDASILMMFFEEYEKSMRGLRNRIIELENKEG